MCDGHVTQEAGCTALNAQCSHKDLSARKISQTCKGFELARPTSTRCPAVSESVCGCICAVAIIAAASDHSGCKPCATTSVLTSQREHFPRMRDCARSLWAKVSSRSWEGALRRALSKFSAYLAASWRPMSLMWGVTACANPSLPFPSGCGEVVALLLILLDLGLIEELSWTESRLRAVLQPDVLIIVQGLGSRSLSGRVSHSLRRMAASLMARRLAGADMAESSLARGSGVGVPLQKGISRS